MYLRYLLLLPLGVIASPIQSNETVYQNKERLVSALNHFGEQNFTWPELELGSVYHPNLKVDNDAALEEEEPPSDEAIDDDIGFENVDFDSLLEIFYPVGPEDDNLTFTTQGDNPVVSFPPPSERHYTPLTEKPIYTPHHPANDHPSDPENDVHHYTIVDITQPICRFFQHSVLGVDFGESTFPRVSFVSSDALPFRVHYAPDDNLRFESYRWSFAACNHACELQALKIRAIFDWELDPVNEDSGLDNETKQALLVAREICQWKNVHHHFAVNECPKDDLKKRDFQSTFLQNSSATGTSDTPFVLGQQPTSGDSDTGPCTTPQATVASTELYLSDGARAAMREIEGIFLSTKGSNDLAQMFHTVIVACQIHRYTNAPMVELPISSTKQMVQQAMSQIGRVFGETQGRINVMETRDAIVRATQIYRYQEEHGL
jgi:hypothetical protein